MRQIGECILTQVNGTGAVSVRIDRADPLILVSRQLLDQIAAGTPGQCAQLDGDTLTIRGTNRTVVYRAKWQPLNERISNNDALLFEWPD